MSILHRRLLAALALAAPIALASASADAATRHHRHHRHHHNHYSANHVKPHSYASHGYMRNLAQTPPAMPSAS